MNRRLELLQELKTQNTPIVFEPVGIVVGEDIHLYYLDAAEFEDSARLPDVAGTVFYSWSLRRDGDKEEYRIPIAILWVGRTVLQRMRDVAGAADKFFQIAPEIRGTHQFRIDASRGR